MLRERLCKLFRRLEYLRHQARLEACLPSGFPNFRLRPRIAHQQPHETDVAAQTIELVGTKTTTIRLVS